ncbi:MAG TPA: hypothetical protein VGB37_11255 [Candidatus Lokiarchaeia archaeon]
MFTITETILIVIFIVVAFVALLGALYSITQGETETGEVAEKMARYNATDAQSIEHRKKWIEIKKH